MSAKTLAWTGLGSVIALVTLVLVVVVPASEDECDTTTVPSSAAPPLGGYAPGDPRAAGTSAAGPSASQARPTSDSSTRPDMPGVTNAPAAMKSTATGAPSLAAGNAPIRRTWPLPGGSFQVSDTFGARNGGHLGVDLAAADGTPIYSVADGVVVAAGPASGFGNWIVVDSIDVNGRPFSAVYGHEWDSGVKVRVGQSVRAGEEIGAVGSAGESSGPHLHFEIVPGGRFTGGRQIDPLPWLDGAPTPNAGGAWPYSTNPNCLRGFGTAGGALAAGKVPPELEIWYRRAGSLCPEMTPSILAAQGRQESGFRRGLTSPAGAQGLSQFLPGTARATNPDDGQPYLIDADGNGAASIWDDGDAIMAQGRYMCAIAHKVEGWIAEGKVRGDVVPLSLAAYNAGEGAVLASGGMPNQYAAHFSETQPYVANILAMEGQYRAPGSMGRFQPEGDGQGADVVEAAEQWLGTPYVWGGGGPSGPTGGGLDGPGLTSAAVFAASSGRVNLPRTAEQQWEIGAEIPIGKAQPGDLVFSEFGRRGPAEVGVYIGNSTMIKAENPSGVREAPIPGDGRLRRVM
ncbi:peptidoglycan DD-metalloendopeptidase family protein [Nocardia wallacei]|uniref:peptidoglycan DD-metalloendopeptidase family protein n=1 Tax=Nocardia wallacei TaxID=480035 RepID=UPI0024590E33|nr:peptidoglycan DD-metalloendopeptidase family protein [Nocardia wallacei]